MAGYLDITEASTTITVTTDDWEIVFDQANGGCIDEWYQNGGSTNYTNADCLLRHSIKHSSGHKKQTDATNATMTLSDGSNQNRVKIRINGELSNSSGHTFIEFITVYPSGYIFSEFIYTNNLGSSQTYNQLGNVYVGKDTSNYSSSTKIGDGSNDTTPTYNSEYWFGVYKSSLNSAFCYVLSNDNLKAQQNAAEFPPYFVGYVQYYNSTSSQSLSDDESYRQIVCLYIGGNETTATEIEADGAHLKDFFIS